MSNEERKNIVRKFKSNQRKREIYNKYNDHYLQLERAKKKQRYSLMDRAKKEELLETCAKKYKEIDMSKKKQMLENRRKKYKEMDASKKKQMLNRKAVKSRKRKISKLNVDVCIMESRIPLGPGKFHVVVLVLIFIPLIFSLFIFSANISNFFLSLLPFLISEIKKKNGFRITIPKGQHHVSSAQQSWALFCGVRTWMGDQIWIPRVVITYSFFRPFQRRY